jgi:hypothetical protein
MGGHGRASRAPHVESFKGEEEGMTVWVSGNRNFTLEGFFFPFAVKWKQMTSAARR